MKKSSYISPKAEIRSSPMEGKGLFAREPIQEGEVVVKFGGDYTDAEGAKKAQEDGKLIMQWDTDLFSFEERGDDDTYFINHSCDSNLWISDAFTLIARTDIAKDQEITADYALWEADENHKPSWTCHCEGRLCRGKLTGKDWKLQELQKRYHDHFSPLINKRIIADGDVSS